MRKILLIWITTLTLFGETFSAGTMGIGITAGSGSVSYSSRGSQNYIIAGVSGEYYLTDGLAVGAGYRGWFGATPTIHQATIPLTYYIPVGKRFRPYAGAFYRYTDYSDSRYESYNSGGVRVGGAMMFTNGYVGFGWVQEYYLDSKYQGESISGYPEIIVGFTF